MCVYDQHDCLSSEDQFVWRRNGSVCCKVKRYWTFYGEIIGIGFRFLRGRRCDSAIRSCPSVFWDVCRKSSKELREIIKFIFNSRIISQLKNKSCFALPGVAPTTGFLFVSRLQMKEDERTTGPR